MATSLLGQSSQVEPDKPAGKIKKPPLRRLMHYSHFAAGCQQNSARSVVFHGFEQILMAQNARFEKQQVGENPEIDSR
ncbi:hypothetical protein [Rhizobium sp. RU36D]|uniref:hypothetical protein n=1 Tax=Rhizobium sp. RU36D TaxID=1907415 RepID=UPI00117B9120|nr:hypothetical protein [Rhizobium sp. RU36D]